MRMESLDSFIRSPLGMLLIAADLCQESQEVLDEMLLVKDGLEDQLKALDLGAGDSQDIEVKLFNLFENREEVEEGLSIFHQDSMDILADVIQINRKKRSSDKKATVKEWETSRENLRDLLDEIKKTWKIEVK